MANIDKLRDEKEKIDNSISKLKSNPTVNKVIETSDKVKSEVVDLKLEKKRNLLIKTKDLVNNEIQLELKNINEEEFNKQQSEINSNFDARDKEIDKQIEKLETNNDPDSEYQKKLKQLNGKFNVFKNQTKKSRTESNRELFKNVVKTGGTLAITSILSRVVTQQLGNSSFNVGKLEDRVNKFNTDVSNIKNKIDIQRLTTIRNNLITVLTQIEQTLTRFIKILDVINRICLILLTLIQILKAALLIPIPPPVGPGIKARLENVLTKIENIIIALLSIVSTARTTLSIILSLITGLKLRLKQLGDLLEGNGLGMLPNSNYGKLGLIDGVEFNGFRFVIKEENNPKFVVQGNKRRYATAINRAGYDVLKSEYSFTLDPDVLIEELKLVISQQNLQG